MRLDSSVTITSVKLMDGSSSYLFILSSFVPAFLLMISLQHLLFFPWNQLETHVMSSLTLSVINVTRKQTASSPQQLLPRWDSFRRERQKPFIHSFIHCFWRTLKVSGLFQLIHYPWPRHTFYNKKTLISNSEGLMVLQ